MSDDNRSRTPVVILAASPRWEAAWRRADRAAAIVAVDSLEIVRRRQVAAPCSIAVVEFAACEISELVEFLRTHRESGSPGLVLLVGEASLEAARWQLMECGADLVLGTERQLVQSVRGTRRRQATHGRTDQSLREQIWSRLPWGA